MNVMTCANQNSRDDCSQSHTGQIQFRWLQQPWPRDADSSWHAFKWSALSSSRLTGLPVTTTPCSDIQTEDDCQEPASRQNSLAVTFGGTDWRSGRKMSVCQRSAATTKSNAYPCRSFCTHFPFLQLENWSFLHPSICLLGQFWISSHLEGVAGEIFISPNHLRKVLSHQGPGLSKVTH